MAPAQSSSLYSYGFCLCKARRVAVDSLLDGVELFGRAEFIQLRI